MRRIIVFFLVFVMMAAGISGCGTSKEDDAKKQEAPGKKAPKVYDTAKMEYRITLTEMTKLQKKTLLPDTGTSSG